MAVRIANNTGSASLTTNSWRWTLAAALSTTGRTVGVGWFRPWFFLGGGYNSATTVHCTNASNGQAFTFNFLGGAGASIPNTQSSLGSFSKTIGGTVITAGGTSSRHPEQMIDGIYSRWHVTVACADDTAKAWQWHFVGDRGRRISVPRSVGALGSTTGAVNAIRRVDAAGSNNSQPGTVSVIAGVCHDGAAGMPSSTRIAGHLIRRPENIYSIQRAARIFFVNPPGHVSSAPWTYGTNEFVQATNGTNQMSTGERPPAQSKPRYLFNRSRFGLVNVLVTDAETGTGTEAVAGIALDTTETGAGTDALSILAADVTDPDTMAGTEAVLSILLGTVDDSTSATDAEALAAAVTDPDTGALTDLHAALAAATTDADTATALEDVIMIYITDADTATAIDAGEVIQTVAIEIIVRNRVKTIATPSKTLTVATVDGTTSARVVRSGKTSTLETV